MERVRQLIRFEVSKIRQRRNKSGEDVKDAGVWNHTHNLLRFIREQKSSYSITINGNEVLVDPGVWPPTTESRLLAEHIHISPAERFLDLTTGSGVASVIAGKQGASGIAIDINPFAVNNARKNFDFHKVNVTALQSDLFANVPPERFDFVFGNPPYYDGKIREPLDHAVFGGKDFIVRLATNLRHFLKPTGKALITYAAWSDNHEFFKQTMTESGYQCTQVASKKSEDGVRTYYLYEITSS